MDQLNRIIFILSLVVSLQSYSGNSMQLYRRIVRQYGHPPYEQIILSPVFQPIQAHRPYHPIVKYDETPVHPNPHLYHHYNPAFNPQQTTFRPILNPNIYQQIVVQPTSTAPPPPPPTPPPPSPQPSRISDFYPSNFFTNYPYEEPKVQTPYYQPFSQSMQPVRYSKPKVKPDYEYHNPDHHYIPQPHDHHQRYQDEYHNDEDPPSERQMLRDHPHRGDKKYGNNKKRKGGGKETSTKHLTKMETLKMMPHLEQGGKDGSDEEPLERPDVSKTTGPVFTYVKTDPNANIKWGVRHYVGKKYT